MSLCRSGVRARNEPVWLARFEGSAVLCAVNTFELPGDAVKGRVTVLHDAESGRPGVEVVGSELFDFVDDDLVETWDIVQVGCRFPSPDAQDC